MVTRLLNKLVFPGGGAIPNGETASFRDVGGNGRKLAYEVCERRSSRRCDKVVLYFHGNAENIFQIRADMEQLSAELSATVVYYDYAGYGLSTGTSTEEGTYSDALEMYDFVLTNYAGGDPSRIILIGRSLGSAPAVHTAMQRPGFSLLVLISALSSVMQTRPSLNFRFLNGYDMFRNSQDIQYINQPILLFHGMQDKVVPCWHSTKLYNLARNSKSKLCLFKHAGHNNLDVKEVFGRIRTFVQSLKSEDEQQQRQ